MESELNNNFKERTLTTADNGDDLSDEYTDADESISAPSEILAEFLSSIMLKEYDKALKYCKLILDYEPNNTTAKEFYPLIEEKLEMQEIEEDEDSSSDSSDTNSISSQKSNSSSSSNRTTASYSSLEEEEALIENKTNSSGDLYKSANDIANGNSCVPATSSTSFRQGQTITKLMESKTAAVIKSSPSKDVSNGNVRLPLKSSQTTSKLLEMKTNSNDSSNGNTKYPVPVTESKKKIKSAKSKDISMRNSTISNDIANGNFSSAITVTDSKTVPKLTDSKSSMKTKTAKDKTDGNSNSLETVIDSKTVAKLVGSVTSSNTKPCIPSMSNLMIHSTPTVTIHQEPSQLSRTNTYTKYFSPQNFKAKAETTMTSTKSAESSPKSFWEKFYPSLDLKKKKPT